MGTSQLSGYSTKQTKLAAFAKALAHPARIAILELLLRKKSCICGSIVNELPIAQATVSQHLKELKAAGLIKGKIEGAAICYCINKKEWDKASRLFQAFHPTFSTTHLNDNCQ